MNKHLNTRGITRLWLVQALVIVFITSICYVLFDSLAAYSALLGGLVYFIPNAYFAYILFRYQGARAAKRIVNSFYKGEALKIIMSMMLFAFVFIFVKITPLAFFGSYITVQMTYWFAPWIIVYKK